MYHFIGDIHGNTKIVTKYGYRYRQDNVIQIGDFGVGFGTEKWPHLPMNCRFIRGNHDNPNVCKKSPHWINDGHVEVTAKNNKIMFVGGANSIDVGMRTVGIDWWEDEELSYSELNNMINNYEEEKPDVMITHDGPFMIMREMFSVSAHKPVNKNRTSDAFEAMIQIHQPKLWVFGHWHQNKTFDFKDTQFRCVAIDNLYSVDI